MDDPSARRWRAAVAIGAVLAPTLALPPAVLPAGAVAARAVAEQRFPQTRRCVGGASLDYRLANGGLAQQGYPLTAEFPEVGPIDGKTYTVQYFERARFEKHPENQAPHDVLLGLLGREQFAARYPGGPPAASAPRVVATGRFEQKGHTGGGQVRSSSGPAARRARATAPTSPSRMARHRSAIPPRRAPRGGRCGSARRRRGGRRAGR